MTISKPRVFAIHLGISLLIFLVLSWFLFFRWFVGDLFTIAGGWQVMRFTPDGKTDRIIDMPVEKPTKPMWGGANLDVLYVTSLKQGLDPTRDQPHAGSLFAITGLGVTGVPEVRFAG